MTKMQRTNLPKWAYPLIVILIAVVVIFLLMATKPEAPTRAVEEKAWQVSVVNAERKTLRPEIELYARAETPYKANLSTTISAHVLSLEKLAGEEVKEGEVIIMLDETDAKLALMQAEANVAELEARIESEYTQYDADKAALESEKRMLSISNDALKRQQRLEASQLASRERKQAAESNQAQAQLKITAREQSIADHPARLKLIQASLKRAQAQLSLARRDFAKTKITAPFDGKVIALHVSPGDRAQANQVLAEMYDDQRLELKAQIPNAMRERINKAFESGGQILAISGANSYRLDRVASQASMSHGGQDAWLQPIEPAHDLVVNQSLKVVLQLPAEPSLFSIPLSAIYGTDTAFKVEEGRLRSIKVVTIGYQYNENGRDLVLVRSNEIDNGDQIVTTQLPKAINGLKVTIQGEQHDTAPEQREDLDAYVTGTHRNDA